ncbi:MAG: von Willebrand factor type A domain-containing protein [Opitutales bacterium]
MDEAGCAAIEARLRDDPAARAAVEEIRATAARLEAALAAEPLPAVAAPARVLRPSEGRLLRWPRIYYLAGTLAAACFAVVVVVHQTRLPEREKSVAAPVRPKIEANVRVLEAKAAPAARMTMAANAPAAGENTERAEDSAHRNAVNQNAPEAKTMASQLAAGSMAMASTPKHRPMGDQTMAFVRAADHPRAAFSIEVDTSSYATVRESIAHGKRPAGETVRIGELLNTFHYGYPPPSAGEAFAASLEVAAAPWAPEHRLVWIGLNARVAGEPGATVARDVQLQVAFNPAHVATYRLIADGDGRLSMNAMADGRDSGDEFTSGETVTVLYEIVPVRAMTPAGEAEHGQLLTFRVNYREPGAGGPQHREFPLPDRGGSFAAASADFKFAAAVAGFGMVLRDSPFKGTATLAKVEDWTLPGVGAEFGDEREAFVALVRRAQPLVP